MARLYVNSCSCLIAWAGVEERMVREFEEDANNDARVKIRGRPANSSRSGTSGTSHRIGEFEGEGENTIVSCMRLQRRGKAAE